METQHQARLSAPFFQGIFAHFMSVCHILVILAVLHCFSLCYGDQWLQLTKFQWWLALVSNYFLIRVHTSFFETECYCTLNRLRYSINITFRCTKKPKNSSESLYCYCLEPNLRIWAMPVDCFLWLLSFACISHLPSFSQQIPFNQVKFLTFLIKLTALEEKSSC